MQKNTVRYELLKIMGFASLCGILLLGSILSFFMFRQAYKPAKSNMEFYIKSIQDKLVRHIHFFEEAALYVREDREIKEFLQGESEEAGERKKTFEAAVISMEKGINLFSDANLIDAINPFIKDFYVVNKDLQFAGVHFYPESSTATAQQQKRMKDGIKEYINSEKRFMYKSYGQGIEVYFSLYDEDFIRTGFGVAVLDSKALQKIYSSLDKYKEYNFAITDKSGSVILSKNKEIYFGLPESQGELVGFDNKKYFYSVYNNSFGMNSYILIRDIAIYDNIKPVFALAWIFAISVFMISLAVMTHYLEKITKPLQDISDKIKELGKGDFDIKLKSYNLQEFNDISESFNEMTDKIDRLIIEVYENELIAKEARLQYLQAQINPHFLFNVLSMISIRAKLNRDDSVYKMVSALSGLMQGKIFRKNEIEIPIEEEIKIAEFYLYLSSERFKDIISYEIIWEDEEAKSCLIPKLSIEPIVENAVIHGLEPKGDKGFIKLKISKKDEKLVIGVEDNGVGFDIKKAYDETGSKHPRVGIMNIKRLIHNLYGDDYGINVSSAIGEGSRVEIVLPFTKSKLI